MLSAHATERPDRAKPVPGFEDIACSWDAGLKHWCAKILPGEFYITRSDEAITTVLGSCISACIRDPLVGVGGMNHFMLPEDTTQGKSTWLDADAGLATRYGSFSMGSQPSEFQAFIFGPAGGLPRRGSSAGSRGGRNTPDGSRWRLFGAARFSGGSGGGGVRSVWIDFCDCC